MHKAPSYETQDLRDFGEVLQGRRTINLYLQTPVPDGLVHEDIEAATWAPNGSSPGQNSTARNRSSIPAAAAIAGIAHRRSRRRADGANAKRRDPDPAGDPGALSLPAPRSPGKGLSPLGNHARGDHGEVGISVLIEITPGRFVPPVWQGEAGAQLPLVIARRPGGFDPLHQQKPRTLPRLCRHGDHQQIRGGSDGGARAPKQGGEAHGH